MQSKQLHINKTKRAYGYEYDNLNRLTFGKYDDGTR
jgi:hypothetical protein